MAETDVTTKLCPKCGLTKDCAAFCRSSHRKDGMACYCRECSNAAGRRRWAALTPEAKAEHLARGLAWRRANPERAREIVRNHQKRNPEKTKANSDRWRERNRGRHNERARLDYHTHREQRRAAMQAWQEANAEWCRKYRKSYRATNQERFAEHARNYKARKRLACGKHTSEDVAEVYSAQKGKCAYCRKRLGKNYHVDHIVPLSKGGSNYRSNVQLTCAFCNVSKKDKDPLVFARQTGRLI